MLEMYSTKATVVSASNNAEMLPAAESQRGSGARRCGDSAAFFQKYAFLRHILFQIYA